MLVTWLIAVTSLTEATEGRKGSQLEGAVHHGESAWQQEREAGSREINTGEQLGVSLVLFHSVLNRYRLNGTACIQNGSQLT